MKRRDASARFRIAAAAAAALAFAPGLPPAHAGCTLVYSQDFVNTMQSTFKRSFAARQPAPAHVTTQAQCEAALRATDTWQNDFRFRQTRCECGGSSGGGGGFAMPTAPYGSKQFGQQLALGIVQHGLQSLLAGPSGPSPEEIARKQAEEAEARRRAEEEARRLAEEEAKRQAKERERRITIAKSMKGADGESPVSAGASGNRLAWKGLDDTAPPSAASAVALGSGGSAGKSTFERLRCAQAFSSAADQYASMGGHEASEKARFFSLQAQKALSGETLDAECPAASALPEVPMPTGIEVVHPGEGTREELVAKAKVDFGFLEEVRTRKQEVAGRRNAAEEKKKQAQEKLSKPPEKPEEGKPAADADRLKEEAEALLRESEAELAEIEKNEKSLAEEEKRLKGNLERYTAKLQALESSPGK